MIALIGIIFSPGAVDFDSGTILELEHYLFSIAPVLLCFLTEEIFSPVVGGFTEVDFY